MRALGRTGAGEREGQKGQGGWGQPAGEVLPGEEARGGSVCFRQVWPEVSTGLRGKCHLEAGSEAL